MRKKIAIILFNLGGPDQEQAVKPFLFNLFYDPAILGIYNPFRYVLAKYLAQKREKTAQEIYRHLGGKSPIVDETRKQAEALQALLNAYGDHDYKVLTSMRYWHPFSRQVVEEVKEFAADEVILLPLYPQFSTTTTASSLADWHKTAKKQQLNIPSRALCCYPFHKLFIAAHAELLQEAYQRLQDNRVRVLFSAHGLPEKIIKKGDPYQWQVEQTVHNVVKKAGIPGLDWKVCYQSKVGPLEWLKPYTEEEIKQAGQEKRALIVVPIAFISEHSETLVELDIEYRKLAEDSGVKHYIRVPTLGIAEKFIRALAEICRLPARGAPVCSGTVMRVCPQQFEACPNKLLVETVPCTQQKKLVDDEKIVTAKPCLNRAGTNTH